MKYEILSYIGDGSFGQVFKVRSIPDQQLIDSYGDLVAKIIVLDEDFSLDDFENEVKVLKDLRQSGFNCFPIMID
jgi:serine/threonine protein kinase